MSYIHKPHLKPLEHRTPFQLLHAHVNVHPYKEAFVFRDEHSNREALTFQEYETKSRFLAGAFLEIGLIRGNRVLVMLPTRLEFVVVHMALTRIGANAVVDEEGCYPAIHDIDKLACVISRVDSSIVNNNKVVLNIQVALDENKLKASVVVGLSTGSLDLKKVYTYEKLLQMGQTNLDCSEAVKRAEVAVQMDDPTFVLFTSGSTSLPKPIQYTNHGFINGARADATMMALDEDSIFFSDAPFDWVSGLCFGIGVVIAIGSTLVTFPPKLAFQGGMVPTIMKTVEEEACTHAMFLSYFLHDMTICNEILDMDLSKLKIVVTGGQPTPVPLLKSVFRMVPHFNVLNVYGATEMNLLSSQLITKDNVETFDYGVVSIVDGVELMIADEKGQIVPVNTTGEVCVRSTWMSFCNWELLLIDDKPKVPSGKNGWHFSKDVASLDENGKLRIQGRMDDIIKCAAESISPCVIEDLLLRHPDVKKVCVVGVPDKRLNEKICACIILNDGNHSNKNDGHLETELNEWCEKKCWVSTLGLPWKPHFYLFVDSFPLTRNGKLSRRLVREVAASKLGV